MKVRLTVAVPAGVGPVDFSPVVPTDTSDMAALILEDAYLPLEAETLLGLYCNDRECSILSGDNTQSGLLTE